MADSDIVQSFNSGIEPGLRDPYTQVNVLLIHWDKNDLERVEKEVQDLRTVFETTYNYNTIVFRIPADKSCRQRLNAEIADFVKNQSWQGSLIIVYYAGHCSPNKHGHAEWMPFEDKSEPALPWNVGQQILFSAPGDVLLILDCCHASLIAVGSKNEGSRFELIAASASAKDARRSEMSSTTQTPVPGPHSFTTILTRLLKKHANEGISSENLCSEIREDRKITVTPVFHNFVRESPTNIRLQPLQHSQGFMQKPSGYLLFRASLSGDVTGTQIAEWLKSAAPSHVTAVSIEAIVSRARRIQEAFPKGSIFDELSQSARDEILRRIRGLNTAIALAAECANDSTPIATTEKAEVVQRSLEDIEETVSTVCTAIETPLLLQDNTRGGSQDVAGDDGLPYLLAAADANAALLLRQAILNEDPCLHSIEITRETIILQPVKRRGDSSGKLRQNRFKYGTVSGQAVVIETYKYKEASDHSGDPQPQTLHQARRMTGLLCHPKRKGFHILPCAGFFRDRRNQKLGLAFHLPPTFESGDGGGVVTLIELYKMHKFVPLGHRIYLAWALTTAVEHYHRVGWVHKSIRSNNIAFAATSEIFSTQESSDEGDQDLASPRLGNFDLTTPLLFGFEYSRAGDGTTYLDEDYSQINNLYRIPERWGKPSARFKKSHDVYSLGVVLLEIALWKDVGAVLKSYLEKEKEKEQINSSEVAQLLRDKCEKMLPHQVGAVFARSILTCLDFDAATKGLSEYDAQRYFQKNVVELMGRAVRRI